MAAEDLRVGVEGDRGAAPVGGGADLFNRALRFSATILLTVRCEPLGAMVKSSVSPGILSCVACARAGRGCCHGYVMEDGGEIKVDEDLVRRQRVRLGSTSGI